MFDITVKTRSGMLVSYTRNTKAARRWYGGYILIGSIIFFEEPSDIKWAECLSDKAEWAELGLTHEVIEL